MSNKGVYLSDCAYETVNGFHYRVSLSSNARLPKGGIPELNATVIGWRRERKNGEIVEWVRLPEGVKWIRTVGGEISRDGRTLRRPGPITDSDSVEGTTVFTKGGYLHPYHLETYGVASA